MKLLCDVCQAAAASVVCFADQGATCATCDARVHAANKIATKHQRATLIDHDSGAGDDNESAQTQLCDICQENSAFFFCVQDRAVLCRDCDVSIHTANAISAKHSRFLLTGIQVDMQGLSGSSNGSACTSSVNHSGNGKDSEPPASAGQKRLASSVVSSTASAVVKPNVRDKQRSNSVAISSSSGQFNFTPVSTVTNSDSSHGRNASSSRKLHCCEQGFRQPAATAGMARSTGISIQRMSAPSGVPFVAPMLSNLTSDRQQVNVSSKVRVNDSRQSSVNSAGSGKIHGSIASSSCSTISSSDLLLDVGPDFYSGNVVAGSRDRCSKFLMKEPQLADVFDQLEGVLDDCNLNSLDCQQQQQFCTKPGRSAGEAEVPELSFPLERNVSNGESVHAGIGIKDFELDTVDSWDFDYLFSDLIAPVYSDDGDDVSVVPDISGSCLVTTSSTGYGYLKKRKKTFLF